MLSTYRRSIDSRIAPRILQAAPPLRDFTILGVLVVSAQRLGVSVGSGELPLISLATVAFIAKWALGRQVRFSIFAALGGSLFLAIGLLSTLLSPTTSGWTSLALVGLIWLPSVLVLPSSRDRSEDVGNHPRAFVTAMTVTTAVAGILAVAQSAISYMSGVFWDPIADLPASIQLSGYRSAAAVEFGSSWMKGNGVFFVEPAFLSLFCALGIVAVLRRIVNVSGRSKTLLLMALVAGSVSSVAVSGLVLVPVILLAIGWRPKTIALTSAMGVLAVLAYSQLTLLQAFVARAVDFSGGSNAARLYRPYVQLVPDAAASSPLVGLGPGSARAAADVLTTDWSTEVTTPTLAKLAVEYGLPAAFGFVVWLLWRALGGVLGRLWGLAAILAVVVPTDGLTSAPLAAILVWSTIRTANASARATQVSNRTKDGTLVLQRRAARLSSN